MAGCVCLVLGVDAKHGNYVAPFFSNPKAEVQQMNVYSEFTVQWSAGSRTFHNVPCCVTWEELQLEYLEGREAILTENNIAKELLLFEERSVNNLVARLMGSSSLAGLALGALLTGGAAIPLIMATAGVDAMFRERQKRLEAHPFGTLLSKIWNDYTSEKVNLTKLKGGQVILYLRESKI